jgi:hypothetical protein
MSASMKDRKHSGRRAFLRLAGGGILGLPLLEYTHGKAWAAGSTARRFLTVFEHGGTLTSQGHDGFHDGTEGYLATDYWKPASMGENLQLGPIMQDLEAVKSKLLLLRGIDNMAASEQAQYGSGGHGISNVTALTAANSDLASNQDDSQSLGPSIDQVMAERLAAKYAVKFPRIHLNISGHQYGSPYFAGPNQRVYGEDSPTNAFNTIFEGVTGGEPDPAYEKLQARRRGVLQGVMSGYQSFRGVVSQSDMTKIDAHLDHLSDLHKELLATPVLCDPPTGINADGNADGNIVGALHVKIILAALRCGLTNVANLEIADILTPWTPAGLKVDSGFGIGHSLGHYARDVGPTGANPELAQLWVEEMLDNRRWRMSLFKELAEGLDDPAFMEGGKTMLDNSLILWTSEFSEPASHVSAGALCLMAGSAGGYFKTGRHIDYNTFAAANPNTLQYNTNESTHNLFTSILQAFGETDGHFGSDHAKHQGPLPRLT